MEQDFLAELKALLIKDGAAIYSEIEGDTHGIHSEKMTIEINGKNVFSANGFSIDANDINIS